MTQTKTDKEIKGLVALPIKRVVVHSENDQRVMINCLEDPVSQATFVTERLVDSLDIVLSGIGNRNVLLQDEVALEVSPEGSEHFYLVQAYIISKISSHVPLFDCKRSEIQVYSSSRCEREYRYRKCRSTDWSRFSSSSATVRSSIWR